jgi:hypothetical protein
MFFRNVGSYKSHEAPHSRRWHSSTFRFTVKWHKKIVHAFSHRINYCRLIVHTLQFRYLLPFTRTSQIFKILRLIILFETKCRFSSQHFLFSFYYTTTLSGSDIYSLNVYGTVDGVWIDREASITNSTWFELRSNTHRNVRSHGCDTEGN